jgi:hypothetical protein
MAWPDRHDSGPQLRPGAIVAVYAASVTLASLPSQPLPFSAVTSRQFPAAPGWRGGGGVGSGFVTHLGIVWHRLAPGGRTLPTGRAGAAQDRRVADLEKLRLSSVA